MKTIPSERIDDFVRACRRVAAHGLARCSSGNMSMRVDDGRMLVTASRSWMERVSADDVTLCRIADGAPIEGRKPSVEIGFHAGVLRARPDVNVVLHFQSPFATALACRTDEINYSVIPEIPFYIGGVARIPYISPGSEGLARAVTDALRDHDLVVMGNHGLATVARDADHAIQNAVFFELASEIILRSGGHAAPLSADAIRDLVAMRREASKDGTATGPGA